MAIETDDFLLPGHPLCAGCGLAITLKHITRLLGKRTVALIPPSCSGPLATENSYKISLPGIHIALTHGAAIAAGIKAGLEAKGLKDVTVLPLMGDGGTADIGLQALSGSAERNDDILYVCLDNEGYMNTGIQGSASTPIGAYTTTTPAGRNRPLGRDRPKKDVFRIVSDHDVPYAATACISYLSDFKRKIRKANSTEGFRYIHVLNPCPTGWGFSPDKTVEMGLLAVKTGMFILAESEHGRIRMTHVPVKRIPVKDYIKHQSRFRHLKDDQIREIQKLVDERFERYLRIQEREDDKRS